MFHKLPPLYYINFLSLQRILCLYVLCFHIGLHMTMILLVLWCWFCCNYFNKFNWWKNYSCYNILCGFCLGRHLLFLLVYYTTRKHDFLKGPNWLKYPHWPRGMIVLIKGLGHEIHKLLLTKKIDWSDFFDDVTN